MINLQGQERAHLLKAVNFRSVMKLRLSTDSKVQNTDILMQMTAAKLLLRGQLESGLCLNKGQEQLQSITKVGH